MSALAFDTHKAVTALKRVGFDEVQAEVMVTTMGKALGGNLATKADLTEVRVSLEADIARGKAEVAEEFKALYQHLRALAVGMVGRTVTLLKVLP